MSAAVPAAPRRALRLAFLGGAGLYGALAAEATVLPLSRRNWRAVLLAGRPDLLLVQPDPPEGRDVTGSWAEPEEGAPGGAGDREALWAEAGRLGLPVAAWLDAAPDARHGTLLSLCRHVLGPSAAPLAAPPAPPTPIQPMPVQPALLCLDRDRALADPSLLELLRSLVPLGLGLGEPDGAEALAAPPAPLARACLPRAGARGPGPIAPDGVLLQLPGTAEGAARREARRALVAARRGIPVLHAGDLPPGDPRRGLVRAVADPADLRALLSMIQADPALRRLLGHDAWRRATLAGERAVAAALDETLAALGIRAPATEPDLTVVAVAASPDALDRLRRAADAQGAAQAVWPVLADGAGAPAAGPRDAGLAAILCRVAAEATTTHLVPWVEGSRHGPHLLADLLAWLRLAPADLLLKPAPRARGEMAGWPDPSGPPRAPLAGAAALAAARSARAVPACLSRDLAARLDPADPEPWLAAARHPLLVDPFGLVMDAPEAEPLHGAMPVALALSGTPPWPAGAAA